LNAHALRGRIVLLTTLSLSALAVSAPTLSSARSRSAGIDRNERAIVNAINAFRRQHGLRPLRVDGRMSEGADQHSRSMARHRYFAHSSAGGGAWDARVRHYSHARHVGEVIDWRYGSSPRRQAHQAMSDWVHSSAHRGVLLGRGWTRFGVGRAPSGRYTYFTVDFAGP
jgi:uncharacterized protein YkwD